MPRIYLSAVARLTPSGRSVNEPLGPDRRSDAVAALVRLQRTPQRLDGPGSLASRQQGSKYSSRPPRYEYRLTHAGRDLLPVIMALKQWGDRHVSGQALPPVYEHSCGETFEPRMDCAACGERADAWSLTRRAL